MADAQSSSSASDTSSGVEALYQVKLLSALRSGDPAAIHPFLQEISKDKRKSDGGSEIDTGAAALHLAVRCGSPATISLLLAHRAISPNGVHPPGSGTTPLHLAASLGRVDVVNLLLEQENIDDGIRDSHGKTCRDVARSKEVVRAIDDSRSFLNASYRSLLRTYVRSSPNDSPSAPLLHLLESPRAKFVDLSYLDDDSGTSLLHEAARRKDLRLIELAVRAGADVFIRNRKGKMAYEGAGKDDRVKVFLRQFANQDKTLIPSPVPTTEPPALKGYLNKYTNVAKGYNTRWFVLKHGVLSYYRHQDDEAVSSRGSISMKNAMLRIGERTRFEVHSLPPRGPGNHSASASSTQKWYMKANHPVEANRWTQAITASIEWYKSKEIMDSDASSVRSTGVPRRKSAESDSGVSALKSTTSGGSHSVRLSTQLLKKKKPSLSSSRHVSSDSQTTLPPPVGTGQPQSTGSRSSQNEPLVPPDVEDEFGMLGDEEDDDEGDASSSGADSTSRSPPHPGWELAGNAASAQLELTQQLFINFPLPSSAPSRLSDTHEALKESLATTQTLLAEYMNIVREREEWYAKQLKKERTRQHFWEESLATVVKEGETLEKELRARSRRRGSKVFSLSPSGTLGANDMSFATLRKRGPSLLAINAMDGPDVPTPVAEEPPVLPIPPVVTVSDVDSHSQAPTPLAPSIIPSPPIGPSTAPSSPTSAPLSQRRPVRSDTLDTLTVRSPPPSNAPRRPLRDLSVPAAGPESDEDEDAYGTEDEDEFFDAIESGNLPNLIMHESLTSPTLRSPTPPNGAVVKSPLPSSSGPSPADMYAGYARLRSRLGLKADERPSTSLWSVLKHSIGKDLTKISFPVFFNEPTSMLQRMAEDMEFSECLDVAAQEKDPLRRIAFVAAFAMSNYSSTIGRIAKPFNPMLSETFEYVRLDKQYRYVSEQVSHHPPISACWAESPSWHYYGEVDAQNKFMGKSFEIRPTGVAHADLLLPEESAPDYPRSTAPGEKGKVVEHYSWKKVTTNVSGFILGSPTIDHYGDMVVTNHRTGDQCILTFKPRGWRGKDAYEISGQVIDSNGDVAYEIAGRWNSQLVARRVGFGSGVLNPDVTVSAPHSPSAVPEYILLWRNSEKPAGSPFNLTPFAITLNDLSLKNLKPYLAPTDCRLRVDQRAFELGRYELANELKHEQEEKQRSIRRARAEGRMEPHKPRWFIAETEGDTGDRVWTPIRDERGGLEYWSEREKVWKSGGKATWEGVDDIFIDEPEEIKEIMQRTMA